MQANIPFTQPMSSTARPPSKSFKSLKVPLVGDILMHLSSSHEFEALQSDNSLDREEILRIGLWQPLLDNIVECVHDCIAAKKTALASKQKLLTKRLEEILVSFVLAEYKFFATDGGCNLPGHTIGLIRLHATNFMRIVKREMCNNMTEGGSIVQSIVRHAFVTRLDDLRKEKVMREYSRENLYYITGWLLRASVKAAKQRERDVKEQLNLLVSKATHSKRTAVDNDNLPTLKVELVERFGGLHYANEDFFGFIERVEYVFIHTLTPELLLMNGSSLIEIVYSHLKSEPEVMSMIATYCDSSVSSDVIETIAGYITRTYCRMRGKDFARKLMSTNTHSLKQTRRPTLAAVSDPKIYAAKRAKLNQKPSSRAIETVDEEVEFIMFDATTGNLTTEDKAVIDDNNLLES